MSRVFNFGSINIDHVYRMPRLAQPGETLSSLSYSRGAGGKGLNQSVALARAGAMVSHIGFIGEDGIWLRDFLAAEGVDCGGIRVVPHPTGHAVVQVLPGGENCIFLYAGANQLADRAALRQALAGAHADDWFLCQNETSAVADALDEAKCRGLKTAFNAAPAPDGGSVGFLQSVDLLLVNESEACALGRTSSPEDGVASLRSDFPRMNIVLTLGERGAVWSGPEIREIVPAVATDVVDTTAAGDTFAGYLLAAVVRGRSPAEALALAARAASITVSRAGAAASIPRLEGIRSPVYR